MKLHHEIVRQKQIQCPLCKEILTDEYIAQNPFSEIPCSSCGSLIQCSFDMEEETEARQVREKEKCDISLKVTYKSFKRFINDYTKNVSKGGMFIKTKSSHDIGSRVDLLLYVPSLDGPIRIMGRVMHSSFFSDEDEDAGIGIEFIDIEEKSREQLIRTLKTQKDRG